MPRRFPLTEGTVFIPFHFGEMAVNLLTNDALDPVARIPEFKVCAVSIERFYPAIPQADFTPL